MEKVAQRKVSEMEYYLFQEEVDELVLPAWLECLNAILPSSVDRFYTWGIPWMDENKGQIVLDCGVREGDYIKLWDVIQSLRALGIVDLRPYETFNGFDRFFIYISVVALKRFRETEGHFFGEVDEVSNVVQGEVSRAVN